MSGLPSGDMREILQAASAGCQAARLAIDVYLHRLRREIAAMAAVMNGLDVLVFTGGIGEHSPAIRVPLLAAWTSSASASTPAGTRRPVTPSSAIRPPR
jgi:acetate kinase